jgi:hypothetical protein
MKIPPKSMFLVQVIQIKTTKHSYCYCK